MQRRSWLAMLAFAGLVTAAACGGGGSNVPKCTPGQAGACLGLGSCQGIQACMDNGVYTPCICGGSTPGTGGGGGGGSLGTAGATGGSVTAGAGGAGAGTTGAGGTAG